MAIPKITGAQRDFSAGELDVTMKRADENPVMKAGARQALNWRVINSGVMQNRPGRTALFIDNYRVDRVQMKPGQQFYLVFGDHYLRVYNAVGALVFITITRGDASPIPWTAATVHALVWEAYGLAIYIAYADGAPSNAPQVLTWDGVSQTSSWTLTTYATSTVAGQRRVPFYRLSPQGIAIWPVGLTSTIIASAPVFVAGMVGTVIRFAQISELLITAFTDSTHVTFTALTPVPQALELSWPGGNGAPVSPGPFVVGQVVEGSISGAQAVIVAISGANVFTVYLNHLNFVTTDILGGPNGTSGGTLSITGVTYDAVTTSGTTIWDDEVMNGFRGWPSSLFIDQQRLGLCNFPALPPFIAWSAIGLFTDQYTDDQNAGPDNAIQELAPGNSQVLYVVPGMEGSEFVFCDNAIYFILITVQNPLIPGSVAFTQLSKQGSQPGVQPRSAEQTIIFMKTGGVQVGAVQAPGAYYRPYIVDNISELHGHLFPANSTLGIAIPSASRQFEELYIYVVLNNGTVVVGKHAIRNGLLEVGSDNKPKVSWVPWTSMGTINWVSAQADDTIFSTQYPGVVGTDGSSGVIELLDNTQYLDGAFPVNSPPTPFAAPVGKGPFWWMLNQPVTLMDQGTRMMGVYQIDGNGFIIPQGNAGENLLSASLTAGFAWTAVLEPFTPDASPGQDFHQRMFKRRVARFGVYVSNSSGFLMARLFSGPLTPTSPALGTIMNTRRVSTWNQDDDPTKPPPLREEVQRWRPRGRSFDPRMAVIKDTPGPLIVHEIDMEATV